MGQTMQKRGKTERKETKRVKRGRIQCDFVSKTLRKSSETRC